ncbi:hypothetical protein CDD83_2435 [Cordyceps sp. RAO-2017]|nr:hypothetical protein CDD83_2435 [Cordyceps sp. RAO-2017]
MSFTCYCAICSGPLDAEDIEIGFMADHGGDFVSDDDSDGDDDDEQDPDCRYNPRLVSYQSIAWLSKIRCLGSNEEAKGPSKAFITGPASYKGDQEIAVKKGTDRNQPKAKTMCCYGEDPYQESEMAFPFHEACFEVLARLLTGTPDAKSVDKDVLFEAMENFVDSDREGVSMELDYGAITGSQQYWQSIQGEEYCAAQPNLVPAFKEALVRKLAEGRGPEPEPQAGAGAAAPRGAHDVFRKLPPEVLEEVALNVPLASLPAFAAASRAGRDLVRSNRFFRRLIRRQMAWAWEVDEAVAETAPGPQPDYKALCRWLHALSGPKSGLDKGFLGLVNRRRVWEAMEPVANIYFKHTAQALGREAPARPLLESARCVYMTPAPSEADGRTESLFFVHDWAETKNMAATVEATSNPAGALVGIAISYSGRRRRLLGTDAAPGRGLESDTVRLHPGQEIDSLMVHTDDADGSICGFSVRQPPPLLRSALVPS